MAIKYPSNMRELLQETFTTDQDVTLGLNVSEMIVPDAVGVSHTFINATVIVERTASAEQIDKQFARLRAFVRKEIA